MEGSSELLEQHIATSIAETRVQALLIQANDKGKKTNGISLLKGKLFELKSFLEAEDEDLTNGTVLNDATHPFPALPLYHKCVQPVELEYTKPSSIDVVGSFLLHTMCKPLLNVDVAVEIPDRCFEERDIKNFAYFDKKQLYLRALVTRLLKHPDVQNGACEMDVTAIHHDKMKPCLSLRFKDTTTSNNSSQKENETVGANMEELHDFEIRIIARASDRIFKRSQLSPSWNNVQRRSHKGEAQPPTPRYNSVIGSDVLMKESLYVFHAALLEVTTAVDAIIFLKRWLILTGMNRQPDCVNGFIISAIVVALIRRGTIIPEMTAAQVVRTTFQYIAENNLCQHPLSLWRLCKPSQQLEQPHRDHNAKEQGSDSSSDEDSESTDADDQDDQSSDEESERGNEEIPIASAVSQQNEPVPLEAMEKHFECVIVDPSGYVNLAAKMSRDAAAELQRNAQIALTAVGLSGPVTKHLKVLFSQHLEHDKKIDDHSGPAASSVHNVKNSGLSNSFAKVFESSTDPISSFDRVMSASFPEVPFDDRAAPPDEILKARGEGKSKRKGKTGSKFELPSYNETASKVVQQREEKLTNAVQLWEANAMCDERWELAVKRKMLEIFEKGLSDRICQLRIYFVFDTADSAKIPNGIDGLDGQSLNIRNGHLLTAPVTNAKMFPWGSPLQLRWSLRCFPPQVKSVWIALNIHPTNSRRLVDRGPNAEDHAGVKEFSSFWGSKAELRRFADGSILQSVVWNMPFTRRQEIIGHIVTHLLENHFSSKQSINDISWLMPSVAIEKPLYFTPEYFSRNGATIKDPEQQWFHSMESATTKAISVVDSLSRALRMIESIPLRVVDVLPNGSSLRPTSLYPPCPHPAVFSGDVYDKLYSEDKSFDSSVASQCPPVHEIIVRFENTSKWPEQLEALRSAKHGFHLQIKKGLEKMLGSQKVLCYATRNFVDVFYEGLVFRLHIFVPHELRLLVKGSLKAASSIVGSTYLLSGYGVAFADPVEQVAGYVNVSNTKQTARQGKKRRLEDSVKEEVNNMSPAQCQRETCFIYKECVLKPRHFSAISSFSAYYPAYAETVRLASAWLEAHMLLHEHFSVECVELLAASIFCDPRPHIPPQSGCCGFLRFLRLLWSFDWQRNPLLVDVESLSTASDRTTLWQKFLHVRGKKKGIPNSIGDGGPAMYLVTPYERGLWRPQWTSESPSKTVLYRAQRLAKNAAEIITGYLWSLQMATRVSIPSYRGGANFDTNNIVEHTRNHYVHKSLPHLADFHFLHDSGAQRAEVATGFKDFWKVVFAPYTGDYDAIIRLNRSSVPRRDGLHCGPSLGETVPELMLGQPIRLERSENEVKLIEDRSRDAQTEQSKLNVMLYQNMLQASRSKMMPGFDPVSLFISELKRSYGKSVLVFRGVGSAFVGENQNCLYLAFTDNTLGVDLPKLLDEAEHKPTPEGTKEMTSKVMSILAGVWEKGIGLVKNVQLLA